MQEKIPINEDILLGRYKILNLVGSGATGDVFICWDDKIQRRVAIKKIPINFEDDTDQIIGLQEARTAALLKHPNIVSIIDFEVIDGYALRIMEAIEGPNLKEIIREYGPLDLDIIAYITKRIAYALDFAHENQVLHLDIKPDNILIDSDAIPKISDFGISEIVDNQSESVASGGTIGYMPYEQMMGYDLDQRSDLYAFASMIYEMLTANNLLKCSNLKEAKRLSNSPNIDFSVSNLRNDVSLQLDYILNCALSPNMDERQETIIDFLNEIMPCLGNATSGKEKLRTIVSGQDANEDTELSKVKIKRQSPFPIRFNDRITLILQKTLSFILAFACTFIATALSLLLPLFICVIFALVLGVAAIFIRYFIVELSFVLVLISSSFLVCKSEADLLIKFLFCGLGLLCIIIIGLNYRKKENLRVFNLENCSALALLFSFINASPLFIFILSINYRCIRAVLSTFVICISLIFLSVISNAICLYYFNLDVIASIFGQTPLPTTSDSFTISSMFTNDILITSASLILSATTISLFCQTQNKAWSIFAIILSCAICLILQATIGYLNFGQFGIFNYAAPVSISISTIGAILYVLVFGLLPKKEEER
ncbi:MAG: serine/threonine protein kinase [Coriobacteriales bacterium]|nr:serine/threonine protein kinase [Coriobacteriales bacterium]